MDKQTIRNHTDYQTGPDRIAYFDNGLHILSKMNVTVWPVVLHCILWLDACNDMELVCCDSTKKHERTKHF